MDRHNRAFSKLEGGNPSSRIVLNIAVKFLEKKRPGGSVEEEGKGFRNRRGYGRGVEEELSHETEEEGAALAVDELEFA